MAGGKAWKVALLVVLHVCVAMGTGPACNPPICICMLRTLVHCWDVKLTAVPQFIKGDATEMSLQRTNITDIPYGAFAQWPQHLGSLDISYNPIKTIADGVFRNFTNLHSLTLKNNQLDSISAGIFSGMTQLQTLNLAEKLQDLPDGIFDDLAVLRDLSLENNQLDSISAGVFSKLTRLNGLDLSKNQLRELPSGIFDDLVQLFIIYLDDNPLTSLRPDLFKNNPGLFEIRLGSSVNRSTGLCALMLAYRNYRGGPPRFNVMMHTKIDFGTELQLVNCSLASIRCAYTPESKAQRLFCACPKGQTFDGKKCITKSSIELCDGPTAGPYCQASLNCTAPNPYVSYCACSGTNCNSDECYSQPCPLNAICTDAVNAYTCQCKEGFTGVNCGIDIDECSSQPCQHNAICTDTVNSYTCQCTPGFTGVNCETDIDECSSQPCQHNATCTEAVNSYNCQCTAGFTGVNCEADIDECSSQPCSPNVICKDAVNSYTCPWCKAGFTGVNCEIELRMCGGRTVFVAPELRLTDLHDTYNFSDAESSCYRAGGMPVSRSLFFDKRESASACLNNFVRSTFLEKTPAYNQADVVQFWVDGYPNSSLGNVITVYNKSRGLMDLFHKNIRASYKEYIPGAICEIAQTHCGDREVIVAKPYRVANLTNGYNFSEARAACKAAGAKMVQSDYFFNNGTSGKCLQDIVFRAVVKSNKAYSSLSVAVQFWLDGCSASGCNLITVVKGLPNAVDLHSAVPKSYSYSIPAAICELASTG